MNYIGKLYHASFKYTDKNINNDTIYNIFRIRIVTYFDIRT